MKPPTTIAAAGNQSKNGFYILDTGIYHHITTTGAPTHAKFYRLPPQKLRDAKCAFGDMERMGICKKPSSPWSSPLHMAKKHDGTWRPCGDYRRLNLITTIKEEHRRHVRGVLKRLQENGLVVRFKKCTFRAEGVDFLGHCVSSSGVKPMTTKVDAIRKFLTPMTTRQLQEFLGMINYYRRFIPNIGAPRRLPRRPPLQAHPGGHTPFIIATNYQPLVHAFTKSTDAWSFQQQRHLAAIAEFGGTISYVPGKINLVADALSRIEIDAIHLGIDYANLASEQRTDVEAQDHLTGPSAIPLAPAGVTILCDTSTGRPRPWITASCRRKIFDIIHGLSHHSGHTTARLLS
ncbi:uncharacterized protein [Palaemon carinicauda]|uniref:uncharacterized protein n=1 Tax=Palaemon carinicauda TaxID=392227 RepID=UPI0035B66402